MRLPVDNAVITSHYGNRVLRGNKEFHSGVDFISLEGPEVYSPFNGVVSYDQDDYDDALRWIDKHHSGGNMVIVKYILRNKIYYMRFVHLDKNAVSKGQEIIEGAFIGTYADVGRSYGPHLHNDIYDDKWKKLNIEEFYKELGLL